MPHDDGDERRYTDEEFALVLRRATEIEGWADAGPAAPRLLSPDGLTLTEMAEIGREVGIAPGLALSRAIFAATSRRWDERIQRLLEAMVRAAREPDEGAP